MNDLFLSVIIPTHNRKDVLEKCLTALFNQSLDKSNYEIIIIDDGSNDGTERIVKSLMKDSVYRLKYFSQENRGPAAARNIGIKNAKGKIVLFLGDDIIASYNLLEGHCDWHRRYPEQNLAILGQVDWSPEIKITPFVKFLDREKIQFEHPQTHDLQRLSYRYFYSSNVSVKKSFLFIDNSLFDEDFKYAAYEDVELGYRLQKKGMIIRYNKNAIGYHFHPSSLNEYCRRMLNVGESLVILSSKHSEAFSISLPKVPLHKKILKKYTFPIIRNLISFFDHYLGIDFRNWYQKILDYYKFEGIKKGIKGANR
ncbi:MAG: glycosyltransferase [Candidatus Omnitrophica bacterium]|nr:glycosyltransferase [Candidatus Omnitrophota bacterium]